MLSLVVFVTFIGLRNLETIQQHTQSVVSNHVAKIAFATTMSTLARQRIVTMQKMTLIDDPFERDELSLHLNSFAAGFVNARLSLLELPLTDSEKSLLDEQGRRTGKALPIQRDIVDLLANDDIKKAEILLINEAIPAQDHVLAILEEIYKYQQDAANEEAVLGSILYSSTRTLMLWLSAGAIFLGLIITYIVVRKTVKSRADREIYLKKIELMNKTLQDQSSKLEDATKRAQQANHFKSAFLANMSHEIRTPLTAIIGFSDILKDKNAQQSDWDYAGESIARNGNHLLQIINDVLDISKIEAGKLDVECIPVALIELTREVASATSLSASTKGIDFQLSYDFPLPEMIITDPTRLRQVLINLINNAIKFTDYGSVSLEVGTSQDHEQLSFTVSDTGIGMTEDQISTIFDDFSQADLTTTRRFGGTGLGLSISQHLARKLNGDLQVLSTPGKGSRFTLEIKLEKPEGCKLLRSEPIAETAPAQNYNDSTECSTMLSGKVLLAEDNKDNQRLISLYIRQLGAEVVIANNGKEALELALVDDFDLVLMDMQMPVMDGVEAMHMLRSTGCATPVIALTANAMRQDKERCLAAGCTDFLTKPISRIEFSHVLKKYLKNADDLLNENQANQQTQGLAQDQFDTLVTKFISGLPAWIINTQSAKTAHDWPMIESQIHNLKGMGGAFGYPELTKSATDIETLIHQGQYKQALEALEPLILSLDVIISQHNHQAPVEYSPTAA